MPARLTLHEARKRFGIPVRKLAYLIRSGVLKADLEGEQLLISEAELRRYADQPPTWSEQHHASYLKTLGPGLITGASDDDPSGIGTYSSVGSTYGLGLSWLAVYLLPMMMAVQETVARIGIVTQSGLAHVIGTPLRQARPLPARGAPAHREHREHRGRHRRHGRLAAAARSPSTSSSGVVGLTIGDHRTRDPRALSPLLPHPEVADGVARRLHHHRLHHQAGLGGGAAQPRDSDTSSSTRRSSRRWSRSWARRSRPTCSSGRPPRRWSRSSTRVRSATSARQS